MQSSEDCASRSEEQPQSKDPCPQPTIPCLPGHFFPHSKSPAPEQFQPPSPAESSSPKSPSKSSPPPSPSSHQYPVPGCTPQYPRPQSYLQAHADAQSPPAPSFLRARDAKSPAQTPDQAHPCRKKYKPAREPSPDQTQARQSSAPSQLQISPPARSDAGSAFVSQSAPVASPALPPCCAQMDTQ